ncbi:MAG: hypothetical protein D6731_20890 [Planctomycetota bacterium]|nr:MAG: hypothetical protein D6731_20890 [Planctomycetota bacterium]
MAPGYAPGAGGAGAPDPFAPDDLAEMTLVPGYLARPAAPSTEGEGSGSGGAAAPPSGAGEELDPYNPGEAAELTMAPGYALGDVGPRPAPSGVAAEDAPDPFAETMPPSPSGAPLPDPFAERPAGPPPLPDPFAEPSGKGGGSLDPFAEGAADRTLAPSYAPSGAASAPNPFADDFLSAPTESQPSAPEDPFGPPLLDDPGSAEAAAALAARHGVGGGGPGAGLAAERTLVDLELQEGLEGLAVAPEATEEVSLGGLAELSSAGPAGSAGPPPPPGGVPEPPELLAAPPRPAAPDDPAATGAPAARPLFGARRAEGDAALYGHPDPAVVLDAEQGIVFAPAVPGGWTSVPEGFAVLSDGSVVGRGAVEGSAVRVQLPAQGSPAPDAEGAVRLPPFPPGTRVDRASGAVLVPSEAEGRLSWRPRRWFRTEQGLCFLLPREAVFADDGSLTVPSSALAPDRESGADAEAGEGPREVSRWEYLGLVEVRLADGWTRLELPPEAEIAAEGQVLLPPAARRRGGSPPPLLELREREDGRLSFDLPPGVQRRADGLWLPPLPNPPEDEEPLADLEGDPVDERVYFGVRDVLFADGWIRLDLPPGARVDGGRVRLPAEYAEAGPPELLGALDLDEEGWLCFDLPAGSEVLGSRILVPPGGEDAEQARVAEGSRPAAPAPVEASGPPPPPEALRKAKVSALDRFRGAKPRDDDVVTFEGVLEPSVPVGVGAEASGAEAGSPGSEAGASDGREEAEDPEAGASDGREEAEDPEAGANDEREEAEDPEAGANDGREEAEDPEAGASDGRGEAEEPEAGANDGREEAEEPEVADGAAPSPKKGRRKRKRRSRKKPSQ